MFEMDIKSIDATKFLNLLFFQYSYQWCEESVIPEILLNIISIIIQKNIRDQGSPKLKKGTKQELKKRG